MRPRTLIGRFRRTRFGYGFVRVEDEAQAQADDLFIPPLALGGALHGDRVQLDRTRCGEAPNAREGHAVAVERPEGPDGPCGTECTEQMPRDRDGRGLPVGARDGSHP